MLTMSGCGDSLSRHLLSGASLSLAPDRIDDRQLKYTDPHGVNIYTFFSHGRFRYATLSQNQSHADSREGRYEYRRTGKNTGTIGFKNEPAIHLVFTDPKNARGRVDGDERVYQFTLE